MKSQVKVQLIMILLGTTTLMAHSAKAQTSNRMEEIPLWHSTPPDGPGPQGTERVSDKGSYTNVSQPRLIVHLPKHANGTAILVISGGGYAHIEEGKESGPAAEWLQSKGVTAFELIYRLPTEGWATTNVPFEDGQRAIRLIRHLAHRFGYDQHKVGILGFSAGGHLAGMTETQPDKQLYTPMDEIDRLSAKPDFAALIYPVITMMPPNNHTHSEREIIGTHPGREQQKAYSVELHVNGQTPPTFLAQAIDDPISPVENSKLMYAALQSYNVLSELHLFPSGGHGWGMAAKGPPAVHEWPRLFETWAKNNGFW
ncbi:alpha/beta hydrolase [Mucilaginibacter sp. X5P1]|uniref:alpha/beta hydrolase n=1 Tax=Mucilaginibacter sp. X5P1 TaxID=2723088 RepID=UPI001622D1D1|nr:alpha/beta hydrolase [Mucilaginibacter sp. X5P1]MBB6136633.1 acetyl esterase/lipase [Mucilaginibacter sp. X5P1]